MQPSSTHVKDPQVGHHERGQTTAEYALVLLAAGTIAMLAVTWAQDNGAIGNLLDAALARVTSLMG